MSQTVRFGLFPYSKRLKMSVTLTENAATEVKRFLTEGDHDENAVLRVVVSGGG